MLAPHELKNAEFSKSLRGYSTVEVDEHIDFLIQKYTELYRLNDELEKKLRLTEAQLDALKAEEESIRITLVNAQKASTRIIAEANERADVIMRSAKTSCDRLLAELKVSVNSENERLHQVRREIASFKASLFAEYRSHIEQIEKIAPDVPAEQMDDADPEALSEEVLARIRQDLNGKKEIISGSEDPFTPVSDTVPEEEGVGSAELPIPDGDEPEVTPDAAAFSAARDSEAYETNDDLLAKTNDDFLTERTIVVERGESIVDSILRLNGDSSTRDDEEFLQMLKNASGNNGGRSSSTDEFELVYDSKKK